MTLETSSLSSGSCSWLLTGLLSTGVLGLSVTAASAPQEPSGGMSAVQQRVIVQEGDTAYRIARRYKSQSVTTDQMLLALLRENPGVFQSGNVHRIRAGAVLKIPAHPAVQQIPPMVAATWVQSQPGPAKGRRLPDVAEDPIQATAGVVVIPQPIPPIPITSTPTQPPASDPVSSDTSADKPLLSQGLPSQVPAHSNPGSIGIQLGFIGCVLGLYLSRRRFHHWLQRWRYQSRAASTDIADSDAHPRVRSVRDWMVDVRDDNRQLRREVAAWWHSQKGIQNPVSHPIIADCSQKTAQASIGFQAIAQSELLISLQSHSVSLVSETVSEIQILGHGLHLKFDFSDLKSNNRVPSHRFVENKNAQAESSSRSETGLRPRPSSKRSQPMKTSGFTFSPTEYLAHQQIQMLSLEEEGIYIRLLAYCWQNGAVPSHPDQAARLVGKGASATVVASVLRLFQASENPDELVDLELQRQKERLIQWKEKSAAGGRKSAAGRKVGSTTLEAVVETSNKTGVPNTQSRPANPQASPKLETPAVSGMGGLGLKSDSGASQDAFERQAIALGLLAADGAFMHRQWRSQRGDSAVSGADWRHEMGVWKEQRRFPSQRQSPAPGRSGPTPRGIGHTEIAVRASQDFPRFLASESPYSFQFEGLNTPHRSPDQK